MTNSLEKEQPAVAPPASRFIVAALCSMIGAFVSLAAMVMTTKALTPSAFGLFSLVQTVFQQIATFFSFRTPSAMARLISLREGGRNSVRWYGLFSVGHLGLMMLATFSLSFLKTKTSLIEGIETTHLVLGGLAAYSFFLSTVFFALADALALTIRTQILVAIIRVVWLLLLGLAYLSNELSLLTVLAFQVLLFLLIDLVLVVVVLPHSDEVGAGEEWHLKKLSSYFWKFSSPLLMLTLLATGSLLFDRWALQYWGGAEQQGFYALAFRLAGFVALLYGAFVPIWYRELNNNLSDPEATKLMYLRSTQFFVRVVICIVAFLSINSTQVVSVVSTASYAESSLCASLLFFYCIHQVLGQLNNTVFLSRAENHVLLKLDGTLACLGPLVVLVLLNIPLLNNSFSMSELVAIKLLVINITSAELLAYINSKRMKISYSTLMFDKLVSLFAFFSLALLARQIVASISMELGSGLLYLTLCGVTYLVLVFLLGLFFRERFLLPILEFIRWGRRH